MAKILISPIGTGRGLNQEYQTADYKFDGEEKIYTTPFVSAALAQRLEVDKVVFIGTSKSMWAEVYNYFAKNGGAEFDGDYWFELASKSNDSNHKKELVTIQMLEQTMETVDQYLAMNRTGSKGGSFPLIIKYGLNNKEILKNFSLFMEIACKLNDGDELYLDITHAFRSIPLFMYLMIEFIGTLQEKKIEIKGLYYGMLEVSSELGYTPISDLSILLDISQWIRGTHEFVSYGNGYLISRLIKEEAEDSKNKTNIAKSIKDISEIVNINYLTDLRVKIQNLHSRIKHEKGEEGITQYILPVMEDFTTGFIGLHKDSLFQLELANWYIENKRYGYGYICLVEAIISHLCEVYEVSVTKHYEREKMKGLFYNVNLSDQPSQLSLLKKEYEEMRKIRNRIAHAAFNKDKGISFTVDVEGVKGHYNIVKKLLESKELMEVNKIIPIKEIVGRS